MNSFEPEGLYTLCHPDEKDIDYVNIIYPVGILCDWSSLDDFGDNY